MNLINEGNAVEFLGGGGSLEVHSHSSGDLTFLVYDPDRGTIFFSISPTDFDNLAEWVKSKRGGGA